MAYLIAIGSSNGENVDLKFGETKQFFIYRVEDKNVELEEIRKAESATGPSAKAPEAQGNCNSSCNNGGCSGNGHGCGGGGEVLEKVALIEDCRCVVCKKVGFQAQKQFEKKAISVFDIEVTVSEALEKITSYYYKIDHRQSLRLKESE